MRIKFAEQYLWRQLKESILSVRRKNETLDFKGCQ